MLAVYLYSKSNLHRLLKLRKIHVFAPEGLMLLDTAAMNIGKLEGILITEYSVRKLGGWRTTISQVLHIALRPISIKISAYFVGKFNNFLSVDSEKLRMQLELIDPNDSVVWINPSRAVIPIVEDLRKRCQFTYLYFLDPVHRLGIEKFLVKEWSAQSWVGSYSQDESIGLGINFLIPFAPDVMRSGEHKDYDLVYVGSPSPKRFLWIICLQLALFIHRRKGFLRLASNNSYLRKLLPGLFSDRMSFQDYIALCQRSHCILEIHERDSGGVTLRATLAQSLQIQHMCNQRITAQTLLMSLPRCILSTLPFCSDDSFWHGGEPPRLGALHFDDWLRANFTGL